MKTFAQNRFLNYLINPIFQGVNRRFVLSFQNEKDRTSHSTYYLPQVEIKDYNFMIVDGSKFFGQPINSMKNYPYFKENYKMIAVDLSRQNELDADARAIQQIHFTANSDRAGNTTIFVIIEEAKEIVFEFAEDTVKVL